MSDQGLVDHGPDAVDEPGFVLEIDGGRSVQPAQDVDIVGVLEDDAELDRYAALGAGVDRILHELVNRNRVRGNELRAEFQHRTRCDLETHAHPCPDWTDDVYPPPTLSSRTA